MSVENGNRVEAELKRWQEKEEKFQKLFSFDMNSNRALLKEKLHNYERIAAKYNNTTDPDERFTLRMLKQERRHLEKKVYKNRFIRYVRRFIVNPIRQYVARKNNEKVAEISKDQVFKQMRNIGLQQHYPSVSEKMNSGLFKFSEPVSHYVNANEQIRHNLQFEQKNNGEYHLSATQVELKNDLDPSLNRKQTFDPRLAIKEDEAYNLLSGRSIEKGGVWLKLDLNDRDVDGNYKIKEFPQSYGFNIETALRSLIPTTEQIAINLIESLSRGNREAVKINDRQYFIEAEPQLRSFNIYDSKMQKQSLATVMGKKSYQDFKQEAKIETPLKRRNGLKQ